MPEMSEPKPLTDEEREDARYRHSMCTKRGCPKTPHCDQCGEDWPCSTIRLLAQVEAQEREIRIAQHRAVDSAHEGMQVRAERDALKKQDESRCRAWAVEMLREEAEKITHRTSESIFFKNTESSHEQAIALWRLSDQLEREARDA